MPLMMSLIVKQGVNMKYNKSNGSCTQASEDRMGGTGIFAVIHRVAKRQKGTSNGKFTAMIVTENKGNVNMSACFSELSHKV